jgi:hypothetical protein
MLLKGPAHHESPHKQHSLPVSLMMKSPMPMHLTCCVRSPDSTKPVASSSVRDSSWGVDTRFWSCEQTVQHQHAQGATCYLNHKVMLVMLIMCVQLSRWQHGR